MGQSRYVTCRSCGKNRDEVGPLSWTRQCEACALLALEANLTGLRSKSGPEYLHWARRLNMATRRALVAAERSEG